MLLATHSCLCFLFFFSSRRRHTRLQGDWSSDVCSSDLYEQGKLRLDDPAGDYLPAYKGRDVIATFNEKDATYTTRPAKSEITIRHLLTHTSGLSYDFVSPAVLAIETKTGKDPKDLPLLFDPGTRWNYSPATAVLGSIIEKVSGQSLEAWDRAKIFRPLGMIDTT